MVRRRDRFFNSDITEATEIKLAMLDWYLVPWSMIMSAYARRSGRYRIWFVDTMAGEGVLGDGRFGSPMLAAARSRERIENNDSVKLGVFAIDQVARAASVLEGNLERFRIEGVPIEVRSGDWTNHIDEIMAVTEGSPVLVFVDPFGLKGIETERLAPILRRRATDVIFRIHDPSIWRNRPQNRHVISSALATDTWDHGWEHATDTQHKLRISHNAFADAIKIHMGPTTMMVRYPVRLRYDRSPRFSLVLASRNEQAVHLWYDNAAGQSVRLAESYERDRGLFPGVLTDARIQQLAANMTNWIPDSSCLTGRDIVNIVHLDHDEFARESEVNRALQLLISRNRVVRVAGGRWQDAVHTFS